MFFVAMEVGKMAIEYQLRARESRLISRFFLPQSLQQPVPILLEPYAPKKVTYSLGTYSEPASHQYC